VLFNSKIDNVLLLYVDNVDNASIPVPVITHSVTHSSIVNGKLGVDVKGADSPECLCDYYDTTCTDCNFLIDNTLNSMYATVFNPIYSVRGSSFCNNDNTLCGCYVFVQGGNSPLVLDYTCV
jgi:hypothetical protein